MYAGKFRRFFAYFLDFIIVTGLLFLSIMVIEKLIQIPEENSFFYVTLINYLNPFEASYEQGVYYLLYNYGISGVIWLLYEIIFVFSKLGGTPGKLALNMEVACYKNAGFIKVLIRSVVKIFMIFTVVGVFIEFFVMVFNKKNQSLHDLIVATYVIKKRAVIESVKNEKELVLEELKKGNIKTYSEQIYYSKSLQKERTLSRKKSSAVGIYWLLVLVMLLVPASYTALKYNFIIESFQKISNSVVLDNEGGAYSKILEYLPEF